MSANITIDDVRAAQQRLRNAVAATPCMPSQPLSDLCGCRVLCKMEYLQRTGSFKERGACNALLLLSPDAKKRGVIAASAGNHALGLTYHGVRLGIPVTVVMPAAASLVKIATCRKLGARVICHGATFADARAKADALAAAEQLTYIHGYDDPAVIAGQGTLGLEVLEQAPDVDAIVVPVGGGGLAAGVALAVKAVRPDVQVIGVEAASAPAFSAALDAGEPVTVSCAPTLADGLAVGKVGSNAFGLLRQSVDRVVSVGEDLLALAVLRLMELEKAVVEGAGASPLAALLSGQLDALAGKTVALLLCGGNIDPALLGRIIERGLAADGRLLRFTAMISDLPGGLAAFASAVAAAGGSIREVQHERAFGGPNLASTAVRCTVETQDRDHAAAVLAALAPFDPARV